MEVFNEFIKYLKREIREKERCRKMFSVLLYEWFGYLNRKKDLLKYLDQALFENNIIVYTRAYNIKKRKENWTWSDLLGTNAYVNFVFDTKANRKKINKENLIKMKVVNEPIPTEKLFVQYASKAKEILICAAYVDEAMAKLLAEIAKKNKTAVRFVADFNFNSNLYNKGRIRSTIEAVGIFRTISGGMDESGIMHQKLYVFYLPDNQVAVFNTSGNFTAAAWKSGNDESPVTIQEGTMDDTQLAVMVNAAEKTWSKSEKSINMNLFKSGDKVSHPNFGIGEIFRLDGNAATVVFNGNNLQTVRTEDLQLIVDPLQMITEGAQGTRDGIHRTKAKFLAHYIYAQNSLTNEFYDFRIRPVPHQLLALKKAITSPHGGNLLFADDVGLGKTIEAGLVIQSVIRRIGDAARVLIMTPAGLRWQWYDEMREKFGLDFKVWKWQTVGGAEAFSGSFHGEKRLIASYHGMITGTMEEGILRMMESYDLVVIDECHKFSNERTQWWQLTRDLRENMKIGQLLLLSATPHSGDRYRFLNLLHLLDRDTFPKGNNTQDSLKKLEERSYVESYVYRNDKLSVTDFDKKPLFMNVKSKSIDVQLTEEEKGFCDLVVEYILALEAAKKELDSSTQTQVGFVISIYRKMLASSWKNVFRSMQARYHYLLQNIMEEDEYGELFDKEEETDEREEREIRNLIKKMSSDKIISNELDYLSRIVKAGKELDSKNIDTKIKHLLEIVNSSEFSGEKFIIFTQYIKTLEVIKEAIGGYEYTAEIQGSIDIEGRKNQVEKFQNRVRFMICTEAGGEGINLQFANNVINFDMPWNPARLQQRIGRVWRYGQQKEVNCFNFYVTNSISDQRVLETLNSKIHEIVRNFFIPLEFNGVSEELHEALIYDTTMRVLGKVQEEGETIESIMGILDEELRKQRMEAAERRIKEALDYVQLEQKDLAPQIGMQLDEISNFYAPRTVNFLEQFAESVAKAFGGDLKSHSDETYEFMNLNFSEIGLSSSLYQNKRYVFEHGKAGKSENGQVFYFGFGDDFFNHVIEITRNQSFGGIVAYAGISFPFGEKTGAIALATSVANSIVTGNERSETYQICSFISVDDGTEISPEHLFISNWYEQSPKQKDLVGKLSDNSIQRIVEIQKDKLKAYRHKDFVLSPPSIESAVAI